MIVKTPSRMQVVRKQEKEPRLKDFIARELVQIAAQGSATEPVRCLLLARSVDSPVVRALTAFAAEFEAQGIKVRTVLASTDSAVAPAGTPAPHWLQACQPRLARNPRLIDAHEFLVLGAAATWIGDSMRRDPELRDAFEAHNTANEPTADQAARSFERLWALSQPISASHKWLSTPADSAEKQAAFGALQAAAAVSEAPVTPVTGATRH